MVRTAPPSVAVAMSGGIDSSVAAALLVRQGCHVEGFTLRMWQPEGTHQTGNLPSAEAAAAVCRALGIPHHTIDLRRQFDREVVEPFAREYLAGRTPNPCVDCNARMKWSALWDAARRMGLERLATGHYARIDNAGGAARLLKGTDPAKEQSYFLWRLPAPLLELTLLPLGAMTKSDVRRLARKLGLPAAERVESQEVCFIPNGDYRPWLTGRSPELARGDLAGDIIDPAGRVIGRHRGYPLFTIGQHRRLGLGGGQKRFVTAIDPATHTVRVGKAEDLERTEFRVGQLNRSGDIDLCAVEELEVKIRYRDPGVPVTVTAHGSGELVVTTILPVKAVAAGQSAVFYRGDELLAGGVILPD